MKKTRHPALAAKLEALLDDYSYETLSAELFRISHARTATKHPERLPYTCARCGGRTALAPWIDIDERVVYEPICGPCSQRDGNCYVTTPVADCHPATVAAARAWTAQHLTPVLTG